MGLDRRVELRPGWTVRCHPAALRTAYRPMQFDPEQRRELDAFIAACRPGMQLFDVGAHFGVFSLAALHYGGPRARSVAVDPSPVAVRMLGIQAKLNGVAGRLEIVRAAACAAPGRIDLVATGPLAAGYYTPPAPTHGARERTAVPGVTLDGLVERTGIVPTHVKIDIEGHEEDALRGAAGLLRRDNAPLIFLELHVAIIRRRGAEPAGPLDRLVAAGYRVTDLRGVPIERSEILTRPLVRLHALPPVAAAA